MTSDRVSQDGVEYLTLVQLRYALKRYYNWLGWVEGMPKLQDFGTWGGLVRLARDGRSPSQIGSVLRAAYAAGCRCFGSDDEVVDTLLSWARHARLPREVVATPSDELKSKEGWGYNALLMFFQFHWNLLRGFLIAEVTATKPARWLLRLAERGLADELIGALLHGRDVLCDPDVPNFWPRRFADIDMPTHELAERLAKRLAEQLCLV
jgi:hypothetical protein